MEIKHAFLLKFLLRKNLFIGHLPRLRNSKIVINGSNNILFCEKNVKLSNSTITFSANNSLIYLCSGKYRIYARAFNDSVLYIGKNNNFNPSGQTLKLILSEGKNIFIGDNNLFSFGITMRNSDVHLIYSTDTHKRINHSKSIYVGDHIWFSQNVLILKGSNIHSGSVIGAQSVVASKTIDSNCVYAGAPTDKVKENVFWECYSNHAWTKEDTEKFETYKDDNLVFSNDKNTISFNNIEENLNKCNSAYDKYLYLKDLPTHKNRFASL